MNIILPWRLKSLEHKNRILGKLGEMHQYLKELEEMLPTEREYIQNTLSRRGCEKTAELCIECVINIISMIVSYNKFGMPQSEDDLIRILVSRKVLSEKLGVIISKMKSFRNRLVHKYGEIDHHKAYQSMSSELEDFSLFEQEIKEYLKNSKK